jgi:hypothetical protein
MVPYPEELSLEELQTLVCFSPASGDQLCNCSNMTTLTLTTAAISAESYAYLFLTWCLFLVLVNNKIYQA